MARTPVSQMGKSVASPPLLGVTVCAPVQTCVSVPTMAFLPHEFRGCFPSHQEQVWLAMALLAQPDSLLVCVVRLRHPIATLLILSFALSRLSCLLCLGDAKQKLTRPHLQSRPVVSSTGIRLEDVSKSTFALPQCSPLSSSNHNHHHGLRSPWLDRLSLPGCQICLDCRIIAYA